jgi:hypothetical protein
MIMKFKGESEYGGFFLQDSSLHTGELLGDSSLEEGCWIHTVYGGIIFDTYALTENKDEPLDVEINLLDRPADPNSSNELEFAVATSLELTSEALALTTIIDGESNPFGLFPIKKGSYKLHIYYRHRESNSDLDEDRSQATWGWGLEIKIYIWLDQLT